MPNIGLSPPWQGNNRRVMNKASKREIMKCHWRQIKSSCLYNFFNTDFFVIKTRAKQRQQFQLGARHFSVVQILKTFIDWDQKNQNFVPFCRS